jgi:hypothetical protein
MVTGCVARNVVFGTTKYALVRKARGNLFMVDTTNHNCKEFSNIFFYNYGINHSNTKTKNLMYSSSHTEHVAALILYLIYVFYTLIFWHRSFSFKL